MVKATIKLLLGKRANVNVQHLPNVILFEWEKKNLDKEILTCCWGEARLRTKILVVISAYRLEYIILGIRGPVTPQSTTAPQPAQQHMELLRVDSQPSISLFSPRL